MQVQIITEPDIRLGIIWAGDVQEVVDKIVSLLLDDDARNVIYFDGWSGLGASAVLRAIAEHPPPSLWEKFDTIIHIDWSRVKSPRARQRAIVDELKLTQQVADLFYMQDEEDDFSGVDQGSRAEIRGITIVIARSLAQYRCLVVFHNGSDDFVDLSKYGIPQPEFYNTNKVLWTFRGRLRVGKEILRKVDISHFQVSAGATKFINPLLAEEAREIALYTDRLGHGVTPEIATECYLYLLSLNQRADVIDFNWPTHASNYWVCDGIVQGDEDNQAWELAHALQQHIRLEDYSSKTNNRMPQFGSMLDISSKHWVSLTNSYFEEVHSRTTSLFFSPPPGYASLLSKEFHEADQLRVLKLCRCTFSFSSPPFHCCHNLRFLGLDRCMDEKQLAAEEEGETGALAVETFQRLWVLDVSQTDWELDFPLETEEAAVMVATNIREVHVNKGKIWRRNLAWRRLPNLRKLRVVDPTSSWETGRQDEFMDMVKLELLDLSGNSTMQVLPSLSGATNLKTLILDGCVGLEHVGPQGLPPSLESFCFNSGLGEDDEKKAKISHISLSGCASLANFRIHGSLPNLQELDLSHTAVKMVDLKDKAAVESLKKLLLVGCEQLRSISWPYRAWWYWYPVRLLCIDTRAGGEVSTGEGEEHCFHAFVAVTDMRFLQSFVQFFSDFFEDRWLKFETPKAKVNLCLSSPTKDDDGRRSCRHKKKKKKMEEAAGAPVPRSLTYGDVSTRHQTTAQIDGSSSATAPFRPLDIHMEIGEGVSDIPNTASEKAGRAILAVMEKVESLHVHDSCSITSVTPEHIVIISPYPSRNVYPSIARGVMNELRWCRVERCPRLQIVFNTRYGGVNFHRLETFWVAHLLMARSIWHNSPRMTALVKPRRSFEALRAIHLRFCPRLRHVLKSQVVMGRRLIPETLHILYCGDLKQVFASDKESSVDQWKRRKGMLQFTKLKHLHLQELPNLQLICQAKALFSSWENLSFQRFELL